MSPRMNRVLVMYGFFALHGCLDGAPPLQEPEIGVKRQASYQQWSPYACPEWGQPTLASSVDISIERWQARNRFDGQQYGNSTKRLWPILFSHNVELVTYNFDKFNVEAVNDKFSIMHKNGTSTYHNGNPPPGMHAGPFQVKTTPSHTGATYLEQVWETSISNSNIGYDIDKLWLNCLAPWPPGSDEALYVMRNWGHDGYLQATNDVIKVWTYQPANREMSIVLWPVEGYISPGADFDVLVGTVGPPPGYAWQWVGDRVSSTPEVVLIPPAATSRQLWITIGSYSGYGQFRFYASVHGPWYPTHLYARTTFPPTEQHKSVIRKQMRKITQAQYFATDGRHLIRKFEVWWNGPITIPKPYIQWVGAPTKNRCIREPGNEHITLTSLNWCANGCDPDYNPTCSCADTEVVNTALASGTAAHEIGHCYYGLLPEEYDCSYNCGHSAMSDLNNWYLNQVDYCSLINGGKDPASGCIGHPSSANNWGTMEGIYPSNPSYHQGYTPDPFFDTVDSSNPYDPFWDILQITEH